MDLMPSHQRLLIISQLGDDEMFNEERALILLLALLKPAECTFEFCFWVLLMGLEKLERSVWS